jgi:two-component system sensor histidine kinase KdpD
MENQVVAGRIGSIQSSRVVWQSLLGCAAVGLLSFFGSAFGIYVQTVDSLFLLLVIVVALYGGFWQATAVSLLSVACLDYFFTPPLFTFDITHSQDYVALGAFIVTALVISRLSAREVRSAREAAIHRKGMDQLYELSRSSLLIDMRQPPGPQLVVLIERIFGAGGVAIFDVHQGRLDRTGEWEASEETLAKNCYLGDANSDDPQTQTAQRVLRSGHGPAGALVVRGHVSARVVDALASLAAIALDRHQSFENEERAESARQSEQLRGAVLDALAHEFKTPLTAVQTASSGLLELGRLDASQRELVQLIDRQAIRLNDLCTRLLQTAKLEAEEVDLVKEEINLHELISEVVGKGRGNAGANTISIAVEDENMSVRVDRALLAIILAQYVDNARKYSTPGTAIEIAARRSRTEIVVSVHNFGSVIPLEDREKIFERFYRSPDLKDVVDGTGIGLSIVRKAAEAHHGHVWVISGEKEGTTFFLSLPDQSRRKD